MDPMKQHGAFSWCELMTPDPEAAKAFYGKLFGWTTEDMPMEGFTYTVVKAGDRMVGGMFPLSAAEGNPPPNWGVYVTVDDVDASAKLVEELGGKILMPPADIPTTGRFCAISDPHGAVLYLITYAS